MSYEQARELVLALIASGRLPVPSFNVHNQKAWANEMKEVVETYISLLMKAEQQSQVQLAPYRSWPIPRRYRRKTSIH